MSGRAAFVFLITPALGGCASWVWNERYTDCSEHPKIDVATAAKPLTVRVGPYVEPSEDDDACEAISTGLFGSGQGRYDDGSFEQWDVGKTSFRHTGSALSVDELTVEWGWCDEADRGLCGEGLGGLVEIDAVERPNGRLEGIRVLSGTSGRLELGEGGIGLFCAECSVRAGLRHDERVEARVASIGDDGVIDLCIASDRVEVEIPANAGAVRIQLVARPVEVAIVVPGGSPEIDLRLLPSPDGYDFRGFGPSFPSVPGVGPRIELDGDATVRLGVSDGRCDLVEFAWED